MCAPTCTESLCCTGRYGYCKDNTHAPPPTGGTQPVKYTALQVANNTGDHVCGAGYKDKADKATLVGDSDSQCCDQKTCSDFTCDVGTRMKASPTNPAAGSEPTQADCCEMSTGMCSGNANPGEDVMCGAGFKDKANKATITGTTTAACCDPNQQCSGNPGGDGDITCPGNFANKGSSVTYDRFGSDTAVANQRARCCEQPKCVQAVQAVVGSCQTQAVSGVSGTCGAGYTERANIQSLPTDPMDWANPGAGKAIVANMPDCCDPIIGQCAGNANPAQDITCGTGYKDKTGKATITGNTVAACCDQLTCSDLTCLAGYRMKASPTNPAPGSEPTQADCCEMITGMCSGNGNSDEDVTCGSGYKDKANKATITGTYKSACCDQKTCSDLTCSPGTHSKSSPTHPAAGSEPTQSDCCEADVTCTSPSLFTCPSNKVAQDLAPTAAVTCRAAQDCPNNAFDVTAVTPVVAFGPACPDPTAQAAAEAVCGSSPSPSPGSSPTPGTLTTPSPSPGSVPTPVTSSTNLAVPMAQASGCILTIASVAAVWLGGRP